MKPVVHFGIPSFAGAPCQEFVPSYVETLVALGAAGIASSMTLAPGDPYLSKVRNRIAYDFLTQWTSATHLFFLDDDIGWAPHKVVEFVERDLDVIAGAYPKKSDKGEYPCQMDTDASGMPFEENGLWRAKLAPTGFMCIKRRVLERMAAESGQYRDSTKIGDQAAHWNIFDMGWFLPSGERPTNQGGVMGEFWGEDYYFCRRWRDMGGEIWIDPDILFTHRGSLAWAGNFRQASEEYFAKRDAGAAAAAQFEA